MKKEEEVKVVESVVGAAGEETEETGVDPEEEVSAEENE